MKCLQGLRMYTSRPNENWAEQYITKYKIIMESRINKLQVWISVVTKVSITVCTEKEAQYWLSKENQY